MNDEVRRCPMCGQVVRTVCQGCGDPLWQGRGRPRKWCRREVCQRRSKLGRRGEEKPEKQADL